MRAGPGKEVLPEGPGDGVGQRQGAGNDGLAAVGGTWKGGGKKEIARAHAIEFLLFALVRLVTARELGTAWVAR